MRKLGVSARVAAARLLADAERADDGPDQYQRLVYQRPALATAARVPA